MVLPLEALHVDSAYSQREPFLPLQRSMVNRYHHYDVDCRDAVASSRAVRVSLRRISQRQRRGRPPRRKADQALEAEVPGDPLPEPVDRDNCPRCNVRFDIGCRHRRTPLSMGAW